MTENAVVDTATPPPAARGRAQGALPADGPEAPAEATQAAETPTAGPTGAGPRTGVVRRVALAAANTLLIAAVLVTGVAVLGSALGWWRMETVLSGSMRPGIQPGDVEVLTPEPTSALRVGQVVAFHPPHATFTVTHRVIALRTAHGVWITTKGDANNVADPWGSVRVEGSHVWVVSFAVPKAGFLTVWVKTPVVRLALMVVLILLLGAVALERIWRR